MTHVHANIITVFRFNSQPTLPPAPTNFLARDEIVTRSLDHFDRSVSLVLSGAVGIGKTAIALSLLHHDRVKANFGGSRHFMRCDGLANRLKSFLEHLSGAIGLPPIGTMELLRPHLLARLSPLILVLDGVECILDPLAVDSEEIATAIEEISRYQKVCLLVTSRMAIDIPGFQTIEVPTLSADGAQDLLFSLCPLDRSPAISGLIERLGFHPLSIILLAGVTRENSWDEPRLLREWNDIRTDALKLADNRSLATAIGSTLTAPTIQRLGPIAQQTLEAIAAFPDGVSRTRVERIFPTISGVGEVVDVLCKFYLVERRDGFVRVLLPFRSHFLQQALTIFHAREDDGNADHLAVEEEEHGPCQTARGGLFLIIRCGYDINAFQSPPCIYHWPWNVVEGSQ